MQESRHSERTRTILGAQIFFNNRKSTIDCQIRNLSAAGARLALSETVTLPDEFDVFVPQKAKTYRAHLRWRTADAVGVNFVRDDEAASLTPSETTPAQRVRELETENSDLRRRINELVARLEAATGVSVQTAA